MNEAKITQSLTLNNMINQFPFQEKQVLIDDPIFTLCGPELKKYINTDGVMRLPFSDKKEIESAGIKKPIYNPKQFGF